MAENQNEPKQGLDSQSQANDQNQINLDKRNFLITTSALGAVGAAAVAVPFVSSMTPSERAKAAGAPVEVDISKIKPGEMMTAEWRGKPVWILNRTDEMTADLSKHDAALTDPACTQESQQPAYCNNEDRSIKPNLAVIVGICTHLGCSPSPKLKPGNDMGDAWPGGFFCPCHGSKFDLAGRVFKGSPAPMNLVVPPHKYLDDNTILIGVDTEGKA